MIVDELILGGADAYLRRQDGSPALGPGQTGTSLAVRRGEVVEIRAIDLYLEIKDALAAFERRNSPLISFNLRKELFPGLFLDPHAHRVHQIAGDEDFRRAEKTNMTLLEVDGFPTLVSPGHSSDCLWRSAKYPLGREMKFGAYAWNLALTRGTPDDAFTYDFKLKYWRTGAEPLAGSAAQEIVLTNAPHKPGDGRFHLKEISRVVGYQIEMEAKVNYDARLFERHGETHGGQSLGTPLLQGFYLLESTPPVYDLYSLQELVTHSSNYQFLDPATPLQRVTARVHLPATLSEGESLSLTIHDAEVKRCEARLDATLRMRPVEARWRT